jgi:hypothetical protein
MVVMGLETVVATAYLKETLNTLHEALGGFAGREGSVSESLRGDQFILD